MTTPSHDLARRAAALAAIRGWKVLCTLDSDERELRQLVAPRGARSPAVLRLRAPGEGTMAQAHSEIEALTGPPSEHVIALTEVVTEDPRRRDLKRGGPPPTLLLEHAPGGLLAELLERRAYLRAGETATILMAVAAGLVALGERGWSHGALTSRSVVFRDDACPAIASLSSAVPLSVQSVEADRRGFLLLAERLASSLPRGDGDRMLEAIREPLRSGGWQAIADAVAFAVEPEAVLVPAGGSPMAGPHSTTATAPPGCRSQSRSAPEQEGEREVPHAGMLGSLLEGHPVADLVRRAGEWLGTKKRLVWAVAAPLGVAVAVLALMPAQAPLDGPSTALKPTNGSSHARQEALGTESDVELPGATAASASAAPRPTAEAASSDLTAAEAIRSDDPVIAVPALLGSRHACFVKKRAVAPCLDESTQGDSSLRRADAAALGTAGAAALRDFGGATFELVQRWGDAALVSATPAAGAAAESEPASVLLVRSEAGWRLRDVYRD